MTDFISPASDKDSSVVQPTPQGSANLLSGRLFNKLNIGSKLNIGFGILGALTMLVIALSYLGSSRATTNINRTTDISAPTALASAQAQANLLRMLGDVRGYLALGDEEYRTDYNQAREAFEADIAELEALARQRAPLGPPSTNPEFDNRLAELKTAFAQWSELPDQLFDLRDDQLQREPALRLLLQEGNPLIASIVVDIRSMLSTQQQRRDLTPEDIAMLGDMATFQASFFAMIAGLRGYVTTGRDNFKFEYVSNLTINDEAWERLTENEVLLNNTQQQRLANIGKVREEFLSLPLRMFNAVEGERAREDLYLFRTRAVPVAETMLQILNEMTLDQQTLLQADLGEGREQLAATQWQIGVGGVIVFFLGLGLAFIFRENIAGPIRRLTKAAEQIGAGDLAVRASVESGDEIGTLAETFNQMTDQLGQTLEKAEAANQELSQTLEELKTTQDQLVETEKMAALGGLVAGVAHEINTPVGVGVTAASALEDKTLAFLDIYKSGNMKRSDLEKYLNMAEQSSSMILRNLSRAAELIQSFKQVAVDQSTEERRTFQVKSYLEEVLLSLQPQLKKTQHTIEIKGNDDITLESYPGVFSQIITNLVMNSLVHAYEADDAGHLTFNLKRENDRLIFEYADDGKGISKENLNKIFDPFFTTKRGQGGSGLGLHIIYNLVTQRLSGTIRCESKVGTGTRFVIELPVT